MLQDPTFPAIFLYGSISRTQSPRIRTITTNKTAAVQNWPGFSDRQKVAFILLLDQIEEDEGAERREREVWTREWLLTRDEKGACSQIVEELRQTKDMVCLSRDLSTKIFLCHSVLVVLRLPTAHSKLHLPPCCCTAAILFIYMASLPSGI